MRSPPAGQAHLEIFQSTDVCEQILRVVARSRRLEELVLDNAGLRRWEVLLLAGGSAFCLSHLRLLPVPAVISLRNWAWPCHTTPPPRCTPST